MGFQWNLKKTVPSVREAFVQAIEDKILSGELKVGDRLPPARQLCAEMGVSLTIVNAGMSELAAKGFVEIKLSHGTFVADYRMQGTTETMVAMMRFNGGNLNKRDARSFWESRTAVDPLIVDSIMGRASDEQHLAAALIRKLVCCLRHIFYRSLDRLYEQPVIIYAARYLALVIYDELAHHRPTAYSVKLR